MCSIAHILILTFYITNNCCAKIQINITVASSKGGLKVKFSGFDSKLISSKEVTTFNITEINIINGTHKEFGVRPYDVFYKDPTPYGNVYKQFKWNEVKRKMIVKSVVIQEIINDNVLLNVHDYINNTTNIIKIPIKSFVNVENSLKSFWSSKGYPDDEIYYDINVNFVNKKLFKFENKWRNNTLKTATLPFGLQTSGYIKMTPEKAVTMRLSAKKTILLYKITYVSYLTGNFFANYPRKLGPYRFWSPPVATIMKTAKLNNEIITTEILELKCHTDPVLDVFDKTTGEKIPIVFRIRY